MPQNNKIPEIEGDLRKHMVRVPSIIETEASGIVVNGKIIRSLIFTTDVAIIKNCNANAVIAVYPFTPQPVISRAIIEVSDIPVFCGVGGGTTTGERVINLAINTEFQGAMGVVVNSPVQNEVITAMRKKIDIPIIVTVVSKSCDIDGRIRAGASILNVSGATKTPEIVASIRARYPDMPIIATGGPSVESIEITLNAGANAITYTPPSSAEIFKIMMKHYRNIEI